MTEWPTPTTLRNYGRIAATFTALTSTSTPLRWTTEAEATFKELKDRFDSATVLIQPDPARQFVVEVDASDTGVGAVLSQRSPFDNKLHPCPFFLSHRHSLVENDIGNKEQLTMKLTGMVTLGRG